MFRIRNLVTGLAVVSSLALSLSSMAYGGKRAGQQGRSTKVTFAQLDVQVLPDLARSTKISHADPDQIIHVSVSLPYGNLSAMETFVNNVSNPKSPEYRHFIEPEEVGEQFGLPVEKVQAVADYLNSKGFVITLIGKNRLSILADATVAQVEAAFKTTINVYKANPEAKLRGEQTFYAFETPLNLPSEIAPSVLDVSGLENFTRPMPRALTPTQTRTLYNLAPAYNAGYRGQGRTIGISNWDGFRLTNVPLYYSQFGLPSPAGGVGSNVHVVAINGGSGAGSAGGEGDLDIQMVLGMAPLCEFYIYDGGTDLVSVLTREVNDNLADVISESYGWNIGTSTANSAHNLHLSMSAQGITYMGASGDSGTTIEPFSYPNYDPEVMMVGGTVASVNGSGNRVTEVGWSGSGGGWSTKSLAFNVKPSWQVGSGAPVKVNFRIGPDVALHSSSGSGAYQFYFNGSLTGGFVGTSFASPVFAGALGVTEQKIIDLGGLPADGAGKRRFGRIQDLIYQQKGRSDVWFDITSGSNGTLPNGSSSTCTTGWDTVTGWGAINFDAFAATQIPGGQAAPSTPSGLGAVSGIGRAMLVWGSVPTADQYNVKRSTAAGGPYSVVATTTTPGYLDQGLTNGTHYYYIVTASSKSGESGNSNQATAFPQAVGIKQLLLNPGFESGLVVWNATDDVITNSSLQAAHGGSWKAWLNGYGLSHTDTLYQEFTLPATKSNPKISFWLHVDSAETSGSQIDTLQVQVRNTSNTVLATLGTFSNLDKAVGFTQKTFSLAPYKGQTIRIYFVGTENGSLQTSFVLDDFSASVL